MEMITSEVVAWWVVLGSVAGIIALAKGHRFGEWFVLGLLFGPFAILYTMFMARCTEQKEFVALFDRKEGAK